MTGRQRAAQAVTARRGELGLDRLELAQKAGVDPKTLYNLEIRHRWPIAVTRAKIEKALKWPSGEMERIASRDSDESPVPAEVVTAVKRAYRNEPGKAREAIAALEAIERERSGAPEGPGEYGG